MKNKPRFLTVCSSPWNHPKIFIQGMWLEDYGFEMGAQVTITNLEDGALIMKQTKTAEEHYRDRRRKYLEKRLVILQDDLKGHPLDRREKQAEIISIQQELSNVA
ncbi:MAG: hypothetical protein ABUL46_00875 [Chitinophaga rupis]